VFDISFTELLVLGTVALVVLGPDRLPGTLRTAGLWIAKARRLIIDLQVQSGMSAAIQSTRHLGPPTPMAGSHGASGGAFGAPTTFSFDRSREYPTEGPDSYGALPEDLVVPGWSETVAPIRHHERGSE